MASTNEPDTYLLNALLGEVEAIGVREEKSSREMLKEAVLRYLQDRRPFTAVDAIGSSAPRRSPQEAAARMLERRKNHPLPDGTSLRDLTTFGRA